MKKTTDLILKIALCVSIVLIAFINDVLAKSIILLMLAGITIISFILNLKVNRNKKTQEKIPDLIAIAAILVASIYIIYKIVKLN